MRNKKIIFLELFEVLITAVLFALFAYFVIYQRLAGKQEFLAYLFNLVFIAIVLVYDKFADHMMSKEGFLVKERTRLGHFFAEILFVTHMISFKTSLYFFYICMLVLSRVEILHPELFTDYNMGFIYSIEYGILLLVPLDKFIDLFTSDNKRTLKVINRLKSRKKGKK